MAQIAADPAGTGTPKPRGVRTVADAQRLTPEEVGALHRRHFGPGQWRLMSLLRFSPVLVDRAEGMYCHDREGRRILDFFGAFGALALGHNHPRVLAVRERFQREQRHDLAMAFPSQYATALAASLAAVVPEGLDAVYLCSTGSEAVEAALKLAERCQGARSGVIHAARSFHGKTRGALSVTDGAGYRARFSLLGGCTAVPFGDLAALESAMDAHPEAGTLILETVQGGAGIVLPPPGYLEGVRRLCDRRDVLWIADEVQCGMGRTGTFFAFERAGVAPDVTTLAKALGGGKTAMAAVISRTDLHLRAYGTPDTAMIHGPSTFSGMGEACCTALETLNTLYDEGLIDRAAAQGAYLLERLQELRARHPRMISDVRGTGLMAAVELRDATALLPRPLRAATSFLDGRLRGSLCALVGSRLLTEHGILVAFTEYDRNVIRLEPPLLVERHHIDTLVDALDALLAGGVADLVRGYLAGGRAPAVPHPRSDEPLLT
jgi:acetylornithine/succinyldiaminopimelate/putrescine aminotransferase